MSDYVDEYTAADLRVIYKWLVQRKARIYREVKNDGLPMTAGQATKLRFIEEQKREIFTRMGALAQERTP